MQKVIICDLDGTLLESNGKVSPDTIKMVQHFHKIGGIFIIATGRLDHDIVYIEEKLGIQGKYRVSQNGAVIKNQFNDVIWNRKMDPNAASRIVKFLRKKKLRVEVSDIKQRYFPSPRGLGGCS
ncbi:HAD hydrolase family protein [Virgibacillus halophilus]|uniref:HAD hydrolase family protein n=1 Tax=Tigheibacillus halophilus TaxID=361280 RepID=A0ABU5C4A4_9BACI|nr:HAD hydrolase family protein [Virgibacillus halophilus]